MLDRGGDSQISRRTGSRPEWPRVAIDPESVVARTRRRHGSGSEVLQRIACCGARTAAPLRHKRNSRWRPAGADRSHRACLARPRRRCDTNDFRGELVERSDLVIGLPRQVDERLVFIELGGPSRFSATGFCWSVRVAWRQRSGSRSARRGPGKHSPTTRPGRRGPLKRWTVCVLLSSFVWISSERESCNEGPELRHAMARGEMVGRVLPSAASTSRTPFATPASEATTAAACSRPASSRSCTTTTSAPRRTRSAFSPFPAHRAGVVDLPVCLSACTSFSPSTT